jgi:hypothetical protein
MFNDIIFFVSLYQPARLLVTSFIISTSRMFPLSHAHHPPHQLACSVAGIVVCCSGMSGGTFIFVLNLFFLWQLRLQMLKQNNRLLVASHASSGGKQVCMSYFLCSSLSLSMPLSSTAPLRVACPVHLKSCPYFSLPHHHPSCPQEKKGSKLGICTSSIPLPIYHNAHKTTQHPLKLPLLATVGLLS